MNICIQLDGTKISTIYINILLPFQSLVYIFISSETTTTQFCRTGQSDPRCLTRELSKMIIISPTHENLIQLSQAEVSRSSQSIASIAIDRLTRSLLCCCCRNQLQSFTGYRLLQRLWGCLRFFLPLYHVGVCVGDECCYCRVICLSLAPLASHTAIEGAETPVV